MPDLDTQQVEAIGRQRLGAELVARGFEVATPARDHGVDLVVYLERPKFRALPLQLKVSKDRPFFNIDRKYAERPDLVLCYVWAAVSAKPAFLFMRYSESLDYFSSFTAPESSTTWVNQGRHAWSSLSPDKEKTMLRFQDRWDWLRQELTGSDRRTEADAHATTGGLLRAQER